MSHHGFQPKFQSSLRTEGTMDLYIETLTGTAFEMTVSPFDTIMSIKSKIQRVEGIPVSHQHLLYNLQELEDSSCLLDYSIQDGATLKLVLSVRGGPISTRRLSASDDCGWKELRDFVQKHRQNVFEHLPPGSRVTVLVMRNGDQVNLIRVMENEDGTYSPLSESWTGAAIRNLFAEDDPDETAKRIHENSVTMGKMQELRKRMESLSLHKKPKRNAPRVLSAKKSLLHGRKAAPRTKVDIPEQRNNSKVKGLPAVFHLPPIKSDTPIAEPSKKLQYPLESRMHQSSFVSRRSKKDNRLSDTSIQAHCSSVDTNVLRVKVKDDKKLLPMHSVSDSLQKYTSVVPEISSNSSKTAYGFASTSTKGLKLDRKRQGKNCLKQIGVNQSSNKNILSPSNIAIVEEDGGEHFIGEESDFAQSANTIPVPATEQAICTLSHLPRKRVTSVSSSRYRVSHFVLSDNRPKTTPEQASPNRVAKPRAWNVVESKWNGKSDNAKLTTSESGVELKKKIKIVGGFRDCKVTGERFERLVEEAIVSCSASSSRYLGEDSLSARSEGQTAKSSQHAELRPLKQSKKKLYYGGNELKDQNTSKPEGNLPKIGLPEVSSAKTQAVVRMRCSECRKKLNITNVHTCRCEKLFCSTHRYSELHNCTYDYKTEGRRILETNNPLVTAPKLPKI